MSPVSKPVVPSTWARRLSQAAEHRYGSDGNSSSYSSAEDTANQRQYFSSFATNDDLSGRSYVDPWDMENYSFLRKQMEDITLTDAELSPATETTQSDFYYVPLDTNGSPQYQYKRYVDLRKDGVSPQSMRTDIYGLVANVDESDFYNENFDSGLSIIRLEDANMRFNNNPSRQSERSRFNNQDYHTYTPPSIIKDVTSVYSPNHITKLRRRASVSFRPDTYACELMDRDLLPPCHFNPKHPTKVDTLCRPEGKYSFAPDVKIKLNRRKSFHDISSASELKFGKQERRKSVLDHPQPTEKWHSFATKTLPERHSAARKAETGLETGRKPPKTIEKGILLGPENRCSNRAGLNVSFNNEVLQSTASSYSHSPLVYVYETPGRRRKIFLPEASPKVQEKKNIRQHVGGRSSEIQDAFSLDPIEQYLNRSSSRYTMTNYGHLKIDYSCSWNYLDRCIAQRVCL